MKNKYLFLLIFALIFQINSKVHAEDNLNSMMALPYLQGYFKAPSKTNVITYNRRLSETGYNLYTSGHATAAYLMDMKGHILHQWAYDFKTIQPDYIKEDTSPFWESVYLYPNGDLLAIFHNKGIVKLDKNSKLLWFYPCQAHHEITVDDQGNIYTLINEKLNLKPDAPIIDNGIVILSPNGKLLNKISFVAMMHHAKNKLIEVLLKRVVGMALIHNEDVYHTNTLKILDGSSEHINPVIFKKGNILISMLTLSTIAIIDPQQEEMVWILGPALWKEGQHNASLLPNGHMMTFDNHFEGTKSQSRVIEFDPLKRNILWEYKVINFYTDTHGSEQRLNNGNTLIIEANKGRAFEVTPEKKIVWEFLNPNKTGEKNDLIPTIFMMQRINPAYTSSWLKSEFN